MRLFLQKLSFIFYLAIVLQGCEALSSLKYDETSSDEKEYAGWNAAKFHEKAKVSMDAGNYQKGIKLYETLESRYPFGEYAAQTQLNIAYAYYKNDDSEASIAAADRFIKINPRNPSIDYAYYLKGLVNFNRSIGFVERFLPTDASQRNPSNVKESYKNFQELIRRFPKSDYVPDAKQRMLSLKNNLAMYEVHVARFYLKRKAYLAAANRGGYVIKEFQRTPAVPAALLVMHEAYTKLGMTELASDAERIYQENYPNGTPVTDHNETTFVHKLWGFIGLDD
ncbi:MAG: outer membrane protein assembly factor BamD [Methylococcaceae bacterium]